MALEELADQIDRFGVELAAAVEGDRLGAVGPEDGGEDLGDVAEGGVPVGGAEVGVPAEAELGAGEAVGRVLEGRAGSAPIRGRPTQGAGS